jgi:hypothetical protein
MWSWTSVTGAAQAAAMASSCSAQERTTPDTVTDLGEAETDQTVGVQPGAARERAADVVLDVVPAGCGDQLALILPYR